MHDATLPLDSYRLARYAVPTPCFICGGGNTFDAELCQYCQAPMALAHQAQQQPQTPPRLAAVLGASGAGKTVYLGMLLDMLSRQPERTQMLARGAFSINLQQTTMSALSRCQFPAKTPNEPDRWNWVHCQIRRAQQRRPWDLIVPDMAGEALLEEVEHPRSYPVIRALLGKCAGALVLIDTGQLLDNMHDQDYQVMKLLGYLAELEAEPKRGWSTRPLGLVFTKSDQCDACAEDPAAFARQRTPGLWQVCRERFRAARFFAAGVAGGCAYVQSPGLGRVRVPLRIEPRGVVEPFDWLIQQFKG